MTARFELSEADLKRIVHDTVQETLVRLGVDASKPVEMQRDFQHLRDWRVATDSMKRKSIGTLIGILIAGGVGALWVGIKTLLNNS